MDRPPIADGAVLIEGEWIREVGETTALRRANPSAQVVDFGEALLTPGLINAHTHLELSEAARPDSPTTFVDWLMELLDGRLALGAGIGESAAQAAARGAKQSLAFGVTCVGDITRYASASRTALAQSPLRVVSFGEIQAMAGRRHLLDQRLTEATDLSLDDWMGAARLMVAISPHAPYSVEPHAFGACLHWADRHDRPITTHLAETPAEAEFLREHGGPLRELWRRLGDWSEDVPRFDGGPVRLARELGLLDRNTLLAHVNYIDDEELAILTAGRASVVWCPRTHAYFGHDPHRFGEMMAKGILVCLGTDSLASAPDLNVLEEARLVHRRHPKMPAEVPWEMLTTRAAAALSVSQWIGSLSPGKWADLAVWPLPGGTDPMGEVLHSERRPLATWIGGEPVAMAGDAPRPG